MEGYFWEIICLKAKRNISHNPAFLHISDSLPWSNHMSEYTENFVHISEGKSKWKHSVWYGSCMKIYDISAMFTTY